MSAEAIENTPIPIRPDVPLEAAEATLHVCMRPTQESQGLGTSRRGVAFEVWDNSTISNEPVHKVVAWERGRILPFRPFYEKRIERAQEKAHKLAGRLATAQTAFEQGS